MTSCNALFLRTHKYMPPSISSARKLAGWQLEFILCSDQASNIMSVLPNAIAPNLTMQIMNDEQLATAEKLYLHTLRGKWKEVVEIYKEHAWTHTTKITTSENSALHMAVDNGQKEIVEKLVEEIIKNENRRPEPMEDDREEGQHEIEDIINIEETKTLKMKNVHGDTPLHLAASRGFAAICWVLAEKNGELLQIRNNKGETPIFLAALNWHRDAFLCLHNMYKRHNRQVELESLRRNNGDTILHCAIKRGHFGKHQFIMN